MLRRGDVVAHPHRAAQRHHPPADALPDRHDQVLQGVGAVAGEPADDPAVARRCRRRTRRRRPAASRISRAVPRSASTRSSTDEQPVALGEQGVEQVLLLGRALGRGPLTSTSTCAEIAHRGRSVRHPVTPRASRRGGALSGPLRGRGPPESWVGMPGGRLPVGASGSSGTCRSRSRMVRPISMPTPVATTSQAATPTRIHPSVEMTTPGPTPPAVHPRLDQWSNRHKANGAQRRISMVRRPATPRAWSLAVASAAPGSAQPTSGTAGPSRSSASTIR